MKNNFNKFKENKILISHGDGGSKTNELIKNLIFNYLGNNILEKMEDSAVLNLDNKRIAFTTDSFVVNPIFFTGGDIGKLSICGTLNDIACSGAKPLFLSLSFIIEEGFETDKLCRILESIKTVLKEVNVPIVTGDTKVVEKNNIDKIFINTSGIGSIPAGIEISPSKIKPKDKIIINGPIAEHGISVLTSREDFGFKGIDSDCAPLNIMVEELLNQGLLIHAIRDATRGGLASVLNEFSEISNYQFKIFEESIPVNKKVFAICEFLGLDPLYIANEGRMIFFVDPKDADSVLTILKNNKYGKNSAIIGEVEQTRSNNVILITQIGTSRILDKFYSEQLPRIC
ncbi:MAG: hydrogenase expression/formation protein HypE [Actinomycetota bacterium]|nr:hydrogenase expression/formation protein HypE [Actinomycetota bacterium]